MIRRPRAGPGRRLLLGNNKSSGEWWNLYGAIVPDDIYAVYTPKGASSYAASLLDISGNGNHATEGTAPGWSAANGWIFDGSTQYLTTTFTPDDDQSQCVIVQFSGITGVNSCLLGQRTASNRELVVIANYNSLSSYLANGGYDQEDKLLAGNLAVSGNHTYSNGVEGVDTLGAWGGTATTPVHIGRRNGIVGYYAAGSIQAVALYKRTLTADGVAALAAAMELHFSSGIVYAACTFGDADSTSLDAYSWANAGDLRPGTAQWVETAQDWDIQGGQAHTTTVNTFGTATIETGISDVEVQVTAYPYSGSVVSAYARYQDATNFWRAYVGRSTQEFRLYKGTTLIDSTAAVIGSGPHVIRLVCKGTTITATLDGAHTLTTTDATYQTKTVCGFGGYKSNDYFDNFSVKTP